jgi:hypothetical protein
MNDSLLAEFPILDQANIGIRQAAEIIEKEIRHAGTGEGCDALTRALDHLRSARTSLFEAIRAELGYDDIEGVPV